MAGTGAYLYSKPMKPSIRVIYARLVAQAGVVTGILGAGLASFMMQDTEEKPEFGSLQIRELTDKEGKRIRMEEVAAAGGKAGSGGATKVAATSPLSEEFNQENGRQ